MSQIYDALFEALANEHRRRILFGLIDRKRQGESPICIDVPPDTAGGQNIASIECHHVHLPKLDDYGFIDWNQRTNTVEAGDRFADIRPILEQLREVQVAQADTLNM
ncbi:DUF7344 domain-containing protein [Natrinema halophilum]|uniref:DUF7344 domain-containing protein n=1 Tax=Natrinema halophilum TaxID=1699371 RepID=A0A7D5L3F0_9EURY|nr:hypothetical protein [Natrinema halophilum]QLG49445.1 hypothetical protein HYG82_11510 [Natrinema halophilum]